MTYDANDCLVKEHHTLPGGNRDVIRAYDKDSRETSVTCGSAKVEKAFDELGRLSSIKRNGGKHVTEFTYAAAPDGGATGRVKGADYYYIRDGLMCITGLVDANGGAVVNYRYDSWGKLISITGSMADTLGKDNPYRYKGYYYDDETGMYYLKSRYYQPEICRFIIAQAMGQEFGVKDVAAAAVLGALNGGAGAVANGLYAGYTSYQSGANINAAIFNGLMSAGVSLISFGDMAGFDVIKNGNIQLGGTAAKGSLDLIMGIGITGTSSAIDTSVTNTYQRGNAKKQKSSKRSKGNSRGYQYGWKPQVIVNRYVRRGRHVYHELQYIYHGRLYKKWYKVR